MSIENDLFFAVYQEHKARTRHDVYTKSELYLSCDVCLYLDKIKRHYEESEREYYKQRKNDGLENSD